MAFTFDTKSDFGVDYGGVPGSYTFDNVRNINTDMINDMAYGRPDSGDGFSKILEALNKANAYKSQSSSTTGSAKQATTSGPSIQKIDDNLSVIFRQPKQKITGASSGGGLFGGLGGGVGALGTALGVFGPAGAAVGGLVGKGIDAIAG